MDIQPHTLARAADPETSKRAARSVKKFANDLCSVILAELMNGEGTYEELAERTGLRPDQVWRRLSDLEKHGKAYATKLEKRGSSGRCQRVWKAVQNDYQNDR